MGLPYYSVDIPQTAPCAVFYAVRRLFNAFPLSDHRGVYMTPASLGMSDKMTDKEYDILRWNFYRALTEKRAVSEN